jgi:predicted O-methyltransferase YrrM
MKTLREINEELKALYGETSLDFTDKGADTGHSYIDFYAKYFDPKRTDEIRMLEIGISIGGSAYLWGKYFTNFDYYSFDIAGGYAVARPFQAEIEADERISLYWNCNAFDPELAAQFGKETMEFIIDDGDHRSNSQWKTFQNYWPRLAKGGVYFIEDVVNSETAKNFIPHLEFFLKSTGDQYEIDTYFGKRIVEGRLDDIIIAVKKLG